MYIVKSLVIHYIFRILSMKTANEDRSSSAGQGRILAGGRKNGLIFWRERSLPPAFFIVFQKNALL